MVRVRQGRERGVPASAARRPLLHSRPAAGPAPGGLCGLRLLRGRPSHHAGFVRRCIVARAARGGRGNVRSFSAPDARARATLAAARGRSALAVAAPSERARAAAGTARAGTGLPPGKLGRARPTGARSRCSCLATQPLQRAVTRASPTPFAAAPLNGLDQRG